jgi:hypothetical protein
MLVGHFGLLFRRVALLLPACLVVIRDAPASSSTPRRHQLRGAVIRNAPVVITGLDPVTFRGTVPEPPRGSSLDRRIIAQP